MEGKYERLWVKLASHVYKKLAWQLRKGSYQDDGYEAVYFSMVSVKEQIAESASATLTILHALFNTKRSYETFINSFVLNTSLRLRFELYDNLEASLITCFEAISSRYFKSTEDISRIAIKSNILIKVRFFFFTFTVRE